MLPHMWVNAAPVPRFYPNAVTLAVGDTNADGFDDVLIGGDPIGEDGHFAWLLLGGP